jgi:hypothetical protein
VSYDVGETDILHQAREQAFRPVPQRVILVVGWASCPPLKGLFRILQDVGETEYLFVVIPLAKGSAIAQNQ